MPVTNNGDSVASDRDMNGDANRDLTTLYLLEQMRQKEETARREKKDEVINGMARAQREMTPKVEKDQPL